MKIYPFDLPEGVHPLAWVFLGEGLSPEVVERMARRLFNDLGARLELPESSTIDMAWEVDWSLPKPGRTALSTGNEVDILIPGADRCGVRITKGALPPGLTLQRWDGRIVGTPTRPGVYEATFTLGPAVKVDPLGGQGGPLDPVAWIPINQPRTPLPVATAATPDTVADLDNASLDALIVQAQQEQRARAIREADA